jgi:predicted ATPase
MATTGEWRAAAEQSRGEGMLSLLQAELDASTGCLFLLDEPEAALSPQRQMALLCLLDDIARDGRSQVVMATHSPLLIAHPGADVLWLDGGGATRTAFAETEHWRLMRRLMADPQGFVGRILG